MTDKTNAAQTGTDATPATGGPATGGQTTGGQAAGNPTAGSPVKDPSDWTTGDEPATAAQESYLQTLATEAQEEVPDGLSKADASIKIDELQAKTGRGQ